MSAASSRTGSRAPRTPGPRAGLQAERTRLAWRRTLLALTVVTLLTARLGLAADAAWWGSLIVAATALLWLAASLLTQRRIAHLSRAAPPETLRPLLPALIAMLVALSAVLGLALALG